jgi:hypothetical protein
MAAEQIEDPANLMMKAATSVPAPMIDRSFTLHMKGDWGRANLHRALGCLGYELMRLSGPHTRFAIWDGNGQLDNLQAVAVAPVPENRFRMCARLALCRRTIAWSSPSARNSASATRPISSPKSRNCASP